MPRSTTLSEIRSFPMSGWRSTCRARVEFDPINGIIGSERLIRVAVGRDPEQAMPIRGTFTGSPEVAVDASVDVQIHTLSPAPVADMAVPPPESEAPETALPKPFDILELQRLSEKRGCDTSRRCGEWLLGVSINGLVRALLGLGGLLLVWFAWPVMKSAWHAQQADAATTALRLNYKISLDAVLSAIDKLDRAVESDPIAMRYFQRSELLAGAALSPYFAPTAQQRTEWLKRAEDDLRAGLGNDPARGIQWLRLSSVRLALQGPSQRSVAPLLMSIDTAPMLLPLWPARLRLILDNWQALTRDQRERVALYVARTWQLSPSHDWFADAVRTPVDELFIRYFVRNEPGAQDELTRLLTERRKRKS